MRGLPTSPDTPRSENWDVMTRHETFLRVNQATYIKDTPRFDCKTQKPQPAPLAMANVPSGIIQSCSVLKRGYRRHRDHRCGTLRRNQCTVSVNDSVLPYQAEKLSSSNPTFSRLSGVLCLKALYRDADPRFSKAMKTAYLLNFTSEAFNSVVERHSEELDSIIDESQDGLLSYILQQKYMFRGDRGVIERPQHMFLRVAVQLYGDNMGEVKHAYGLMSSLMYIPSTPILMNSGTINPAMAASFCFPLEDDLRDLFGSLERTAVLSKNGGGIGLERNTRTLPDGRIRPGLLPLLRLVNAAVTVVDQGQLLRPPAINASVEIWHADAMPFITLRKPSGNPPELAKSMFQCLWLNDLLLVNAYGEDFAREYSRLEELGVGAESVRARDVWMHILETIITTGGPSIMFKDATNGTILQSSVCMETAQFSDDQETAVCVFASLVLPAFVSPDRRLRLEDLEAAVRHVVRSLNRVLRESHFPVESTKASAYSHRSIGIGAQGLADTFAMLAAPYDSAKARDINLLIFETIYYAAVDESCNETQVYGPHPSFRGSPASRGILQFDMWEEYRTTGRYDWTALRAKMRKGIANSLLTACMPTAGTSQIAGYTEGTEPFTSTPGHLIQLLDDKGLWDDEMMHRIMAANGVLIILQDVYRTSWEVDPSAVIRLAADRGPYVCQSQAMTLYVSPPSVDALSRQLYHAWGARLKTGLSSIVARPCHRAVQVVHQSAEDRAVSEVPTEVVDYSDPEVLLYPE
ncbi:hypothetical protein D9611_014254 [Ephemerocybe angulata]|uniref:Ribonucleoside-diphosphate reductase n=1 Tax=Ephemerocybe angulata TaxID=980116 RepID=A0A8H5BST2_9AGAR|nr:hypothetical protein D9611_014254 [Tulosesus angulatus]